MRSAPIYLAILAVAITTACKPAPTAAPPSTSKKVVTLADARRGFVTHLIRQNRTDEPVPPPPPEIFHLVHYPSAEELPAYVGVAPPTGGKHPAIIWLVGGFSNSIGEVAWTPGKPENDQSASAFREAGIVMMYPALRGGNDSHGFKEGFYGEVDDVLAAVEYLSKVDYVDPQRIYLGGHSTGGTLALLVAESTDRFRAIFSFGPADDVRGYGAEVLPFNLKSQREAELRAPSLYLQGIRTPTFVFEGSSGRSNIASLRAMVRLPHPDNVHFQSVPWADHFGTIQPLSRLIAKKILTDQGPDTNIAFSEQEILLAMPNGK
jgi:alpha/beta superfamily hydrolase